MPLTIRSARKVPGVFVVTLAGELDSETSLQLENALEGPLAENPSLIVFDMADLGYISSAGVRVLVKTQKAMVGVKGKVSLIHLQPGVRRVFDIIKVLPPSQIFASVEELDNYLDHIQRQMAAE